MEEPPESAHLPPEDDKAVTRQNVIEKLCFARFGLRLKEHDGEEALKKDLNSFNNESARALVTHQTIQKWCGNSTHPLHHDAFEFLLNYTNHSFSPEFLNTLNEERKKVHAQIVRCIRINLESTTIDKKIYRRSNGWYVLNIKTPTEILERLTQQLSGHYFTFRLRLNRSERKPIAQEVLSIERRESDLSFEHWHRLDNGRMAKFEGTIMPVGEILWFISVRGDQSSPERLRVMHIRDIRGRYSPLRWGIISTDVPHPSQEPASSKIVLLKTQNKSETIERFADEHVKYIDYDELSPEINRVMRRLLDNNITCHSTANTFEPESSGGSTKVDSILRVDQNTAAAAGNYLLDLTPRER